MALLDVCGFQDTILFSRWTYEDSTSIYSEDILHLGKRSKTLKAQVAEDGSNPLQFIFPLQQKDHCNSSTSFLTQCPVPLCHGTTTLGFVFQGGVIAAADTRASCAGLIACPAAQKIMPIHSHLVTTTSGSGADCMLWERILTREIRLYQLRFGRRLTVSGAAKLLSLMLHPFKGTDVCVALTLAGWDVEHAKTEVGICKRLNDDGETHSNMFEPGNARSTPSSNVSNLKESALVKSCQSGTISSKSNGNLSQHNSGQNLCGSQSIIIDHSGPRLCYVCSDGLRLKGDLISVGSGSPYAYSVLDDGWRWNMSLEEAVALAREAVCKATHRDAYSGNNVDLFHITECGWRRRPREDVKEEYYHQKNMKDRMIQENCV